MAGTPVWGRAVKKMTSNQLSPTPQQEWRLSCAGRGRGEGPAAGPAVWPGRHGRLQAGMKYLGAHIPRKWKLTSKMKC